MFLYLRIFLSLLLSVNLQRVHEIRCTENAQENEEVFRSTVLPRSAVRSSSQILSRRTPLASKMPVTSLRSASQIVIEFAAGPTAGGIANSDIEEFKLRALVLFCTLSLHALSHDLSCNSVMITVIIHSYSSVASFVLLSIARSVVTQ